MPKLMNGISSLPNGQQSVVFQMILRVLSQWIVPLDEATIADTFKLSERGNDEDFLIEKFTDLLMFNMGYFSINKPTAPVRGLLGSHQSALTTLRRTLLGTARGPPLANQSRGGLSVKGIEFLTPHKETTFTLKTLNAAKLGILNFLSTPVFAANTKFPALLVASFDGNSEVANRAADLIRRKCPADLEDLKLCERLSNMFLGDNQVWELFARRVLERVSSVDVDMEDVHEEQAADSVGIEHGTEPDATTIATEPEQTDSEVPTASPLSSMRHDIRGDEASWRLPVADPIRVKILQLFSKSKRAVSDAARSTQIVQAGMSGPLLLQCDSL